MAYSTQRVTSDGTLVLLSLSLEYFDRSEITVYFNGVLNTTGWAWVGTTGSQISFSPAVPNTVEITVKRTTDIGAIRHKFSLGAAFITSNVDDDLTQVLHIAQEAVENAALSEIFNTINMHGYSLINVAAGVSPGDAVNKAQMDVHTTTTLGYKDAAAVSAVASAASAAASANSAAAALVSEQAAAAVVLGNFATLIHAAPNKAVPVDADEFGIYNSVGGVLGRLTFANLKAQAGFPVGTKLVFAQAAAPSGWTQDTSNDQVLRVVSSAGGGSGGTLSITSAVTGGHALSAAENGVHSHGVVDPGHTHVQRVYSAISDSGNVPIGYANVGGDVSGPYSTNSATTGISIQNSAGGAAHTHPLAIKYQDVIICSKN